MMESILVMAAILVQVTTGATELLICVTLILVTHYLMNAIVMHARQMIRVL